MTCSNVSMGFQELLVWQRSRQLAAECYRLTERFSFSERLGISSQIRRAAVSISANIAEGYGRTGKDRSRFADIAHGSILELESHLLIAKDAKLADVGEFRTVEHLLDESLRLLKNYRDYLRQEPRR